MMDSVKREYEAELKYSYRAWKDRAEKAEQQLRDIGAYINKHHPLSLVSTVPIEAILNRSKHE